MDLEEHAYQKKKSAETTLVKVITEIEKVFKSEFALNILLDIEVAFNHTSVKSICQGPKEHEAHITVEAWMRQDSRRLVAEWKNTDERSGLERDAHKVGPCPPTMWYLVVDNTDSY